MRNLDLNLGRACNYRCVFCSNGALGARERGWMRHSEAQNELSLGRQSGFTSVCFLGGEATLYPHLAELVRYSRELGFSRIAVCSNGGRLSEPAHLETLLASGLTRVALSVHSERETVEDVITQHRGSFQQKLKAIDNLVHASDSSRLKDGFSLNVVIHKKNVRRLTALVRFYFSRGVRDFRFNFIRPENQALGNRRWVARFTDARPFLRTLLQFAETEVRVRISLADIPVCQLPWEVWSNPGLLKKIWGDDWDLETQVALLQPNCETADRIHRFSWDQQKRDLLKRYPVGCRGCSLPSRCPGVWSQYLALYGEEEFSAPPAGPPFTPVKTK